MTEENLTNDNNDKGDLSDSQRKVLSSVVFLPALLSILGSSVIIWSILRGKDSKKRSYQRILLGISIADIFNTVCLITNPFMLPAARSDRIWASGNERTCHIAAFLLQWSFCNYYYSCCLNWYFFCVIRYEMREERITRKVEPWLHAVAIGFPLLGAIVMASAGALGADNSAGAVCLVNLDEESGQYTLNFLLGFFFLAVPLFLFVIYIIVVNILIYLRVRTVISRSRRFSIRAGDMAGGQHQALKIREVATQNALYVMTFSILLVVLLVNNLAHAFGVTEKQLFPVIVIENILTPMQGFFNAVIFSRPKYIAARVQFPEETKWWAIRRSFSPSLQPKTQDTNPPSASATN